MPKLLWLSIARARIQASVNRWRISVLCRASCQCLAFSSRDALVDGSSRPRLETPHEVPPTLSLPVLGSDGPVDPHSLVSGLPSGFEVVAPRAPPLSGGLPSSGVSRPQLLVRRLGRGLGGTFGPSHRFRPLVRGRGCALYQRKRASGGSSESPPLPVVSGG